MQNSKLVKRIFITLTILFVSVVSIAFLLIYLYEDNIKSYSIKQINKSINARIDVENIDLSFFSQFPKASLDFHNVSFYNKDEKKSKSAIIESEKIFLSFDILELLNNNYNLQEIVIENANINFEIFKNGDNNFTFLTSSNDTDSGSFLLSLNAVSFINTTFNYHNRAINQKFQLLITAAKAKGVFSDKNFGIDLKGKTKLNYLYNQSRLILSHKNIDLDVSTTFDIEKDHYSLKKGLLTYNGIPLKLNGGIQLYKNSIGINAKLSAKMLRISDIKSNIDKEFLAKIDDYNINGLLSIEGNIGGRIGGKYKPKLSVLASLDNVGFELKEYGLIFNDLSLKLKYNNGKKRNLQSSSISVSKLSGNSNIGDFKDVGIEINNLWQPKIKAKIIGNWDLAEVNKALKIDTITNLSGKLATQTWLTLGLKYSEENTSWSINNWGFDNNFNIQNASITFKDSEISYSGINTKGRIENNKIIIYSLTTQTQKSKLSVLGSIYNLPYGKSYHKNKPLVINLIMNTDKLSYNEIMKALPSGSDNNDDTRFSNDLDIVIDIKADEFAYSNITINKLSGRFQMRNRRLSFFNIKGLTIKGSIDGMMWIDGSKNGQYDLFSKGKTKDIDITKTFDVFNNFDQQIITSNNISGNLDSDYDLKCSFDHLWKINTKSIELSTDMLLKNGVLKDVESLNALKSYTKIDDFSELKFDELKNSISVINSQIIIPEMKVKSNKMNIDLSGTHNFDNSYEYHFTILLSEVMGKKYNKTITGEFGEVENDGYGRTKLFLTLKGKGETFEVEYDKSGLTKKLKTDLQEEKQSLKKALNEEFGWFKAEEKKAIKDSIKTPKQEKVKEKEVIKKQEEGEFIIDWDDE